MKYDVLFYPFYLLLLCVPSFILKESKYNKLRVGNLPLTQCKILKTDNQRSRTYRQGRWMPVFDIIAIGHKDVISGDWEKKGERAISLLYNRRMNTVNSYLETERRRLTRYFFLLSLILNNENEYRILNYKKLPVVYLNKLKKSWMTL